MCGIAGIYGTSDRNIIGNMTASLKHRGPDGENIVVTARHSLGATRLALVGGEKAAIPFFNQGVYILLNGEIYNYKDLREKLARAGYLFKTDGEAEVISALYKKYGRFFAGYLEGMFAIAILDDDKLILTRDHYGIKPLFYFQDGRKLAFASEVKSLFRYPNFTFSLNQSAMEEVALFGFIHSTSKTLFQNIVQVEPGEVVEFVDAVLIKEKYQTPEVISDKLDYSAAVQAIQAVFCESMEKMWFHGRGEKGIYLSGGIDSTLEVLLAKELVIEPVNTFTLYESPDSDDYHYASLVARLTGAKHHEFLVGEEDYWAELPHLVFHYESPMMGGVFDIQGALAFHILSRRVAEHVRIAFSGEGADELFGGYRWIHAHPLGFSDRIRERIKRIKVGLQTNALVDSLFPLPEDERLYRKNVYDFLLCPGLANYHLWSVDRSCSAFGFEVRPFYLYNQIARFAENLPMEFKVPDHCLTKRILRDAAWPLFSRWGLDAVLSREKRGMPAAIASIGERINEYLERAVSPRHISNHPYREMLITPLEIFMFDLFYYIFFIRHADLPANFRLKEALASGEFEHMYD